MRETYNSAVEAEADRARQKALLAALNACTGTNAASGALELGRAGLDPHLGRWHLRPHWTWTKRRLEFCTVTQDGDEEGVLRLHHLPTPEQADIIRDVLGVRKRMEFSARTWNGAEPRCRGNCQPKDGQTRPARYLPPSGDRQAILRGHRRAQASKSTPCQKETPTEADR